MLSSVKKDLLEQLRHIEKDFKVFQRRGVGMGPLLYEYSFTKEQVGLMIDGIRDFVARTPA